MAHGIDSGAGEMISTPSKTLLDATAAIVVGEAGVFLAPILMSTEVAGWALTNAQAGDLIGLELIALAAFGVLASRFVQPNRWRAMFVAGGFLVAAGNLTCAFFGGLASLIIGRLLVSGGGGLTATVGAAMLATSGATERDSNRSFALQNLFFAALLLGLPWSLSFWGRPGFFGSLTAISAALTIWRCAKARTVRDIEQTAQPLVLPHLRRNIGRFFISVTLLWIAGGAIYTYSGRAGLNLGITDRAVGATLAVANLCGMLACLIAGSVGVKWPLTRMLLGSCTVATIAGALSIGSSRPWIYVVCYMLYLSGNMLQTSYALALAARLDDRGRVAAAFLSYIAVPFALGPVAIGYYAERSTPVSMAEGVLIMNAIAIAVMFSVVRAAPMSPTVAASK